jgi:hypothetical protein
MAYLETSSRAQGSSFLDIGPASARAVALPLLLAGTLLSVQTRNTLYRIVVEDGSALRVSVSGGQLFQHTTNAELVGAMDDDGSPKVGWIVEGLPLQLRTDTGPVITSTVESVAVDVDAPSVTEDNTH